MATIGYADLPVPAGGSGPDMPAAFAALATTLDPHLVQTVDDSADRDTTLSAAPLGQVAVAADGTMWVKTSAIANTWATLWEPRPAWQPVTPASGYTGLTQVPQALILGNGQVFLRGRIAKTDSSLIVGSGGIAIGTVPDAAIPEVLAFIAGGASLTGDAMTGVGRVEVMPVGTSSPLGDDGTVIWYSQDGIQDSGTPGVTWIDISGNYWLT